jgi:hypothetical protein
MKLVQVFGREVGHGGRIPRGFQMAWYEPRRRVGVYFPSPLHWILRALRELAYRLRVALQAPALERADVFAMQRTHRERQRLAEEYARGYLSGWRECFETCMAAVEDEIVRMDDVWDASALLLDDGKHENESN